MLRAACAMACALTGAPKSRGSERPRTDACWSRSPKASIAVTSKPARAADSAAARVETPAMSTRFIERSAALQGALRNLNVAQPFRACEEIAVVQAFRPAVSGGPEGPHYISSDFFTGSLGLPGGR